MPENDLYAILGIQPDAEGVVVTGAYRALVQRYHPDRWTGDPADAHQRMAEINRAYAVLGDTMQRTKYDGARTRSKQADFSTNDDYGDAFAAALAGVEERWKIACGIYPDLPSLRAELDRISTALALAFVTTLLESKTFTKRAEVAAHLERAFFERYFGPDPKLVRYARWLIVARQRPAALALNRLVDVLGSDVDPNLLISRVDQEFGVQELWTSHEQTIARQGRIQALARHVGRYEDFAAAQEVAQLLGYAVAAKRRRRWVTSRSLSLSRCRHLAQARIHRSAATWDTPIMSP